MTSTTLSKSVFFVSDGFGLEPKIYKSDNGNKTTYKGVAVFRSGTFRDSSGMQNTWEPIHLKQMMDNYNHLTSSNILSGIPVRDGHPGFLVSGMQGKGNVVGWHESIQIQTLKSPVDGTEYDYLLADYTITEAYAQQKLDSGTWRNRSAEIGYYTTNAEAEFWPVYMGFAFVDFPAVEGLNFSSSQGTRCFVHFGGQDYRENVVTETTAASGAAGQGNGVATGLLPFSLPTQPPAQQPAAPFKFSVNGTETTDPTVVQAYINRLETWAREARDGARKSFVASLIQAQKIPAPQKDEFERFALRLDDQAYEMWTQQWAAMGVNPLFANHASGISNPGNAAQGSAVPQDIQDAKEIVGMHRRNGMPLDALKATPSYKKLVTAGIEQA